MWSGMQGRRTTSTSGIPKHNAHEQPVVSLTKERADLRKIEGIHKCHTCSKPPLSSMRNTIVFYFLLL